MSDVLHPRNWRLHAEITLARLGLWLPLSGLVSLASLALWLAVIPTLQREVITKQQQLDILLSSPRVTSTINAPSLDTGAGNLQAFETMLLDNARQAETLKSLFSLARQQGLSVAQANYRNTLHPKNYYHTTQITLPLRGSYTSIRRFSMEALIKHPYCSIEEIAFKREGIGSDEVEAKLRMTLWLKPLSNTTQAHLPTSGGKRS